MTGRTLHQETGVTNGVDENGERRKALGRHDLGRVSPGVGDQLDVLHTRLLALTVTPTFHDPTATLDELLTALRAAVAESLTQTTPAERWCTIADVLRTAGTLYGDLGRDLARQRAGEPPAIQVACPVCGCPIRPYPTLRQAMKALEAHANTSHTNKDIAQTDIAPASTCPGVAGSERSAAESSTAPGNDLRGNPNMPVLAVLEHQLRAAVHRLLVDRSHTGRAALITSIRQRLLPLEPVLADLAPRVLDLLHKLSTVGDPRSDDCHDQIVDDLLNADRHLHTALRELGVDAYQPSATHAGTNLRVPLVLTRSVSRGRSPQPAPEGACP